MRRRYRDTADILLHQNAAGIMGDAFGHARKLGAIKCAIGLLKRLDPADCGFQIGGWVGP